ncbi:hypothetical protein PIB30_071973 [Stylosanthes scabra]|uniref:glucan endo-1,3-beta-D-glucosidase n=1 Tax=Stylosanthes scabra TaxID=79078 RepID=A0ABU6RPB7_9FABA|nr:hypothetical protein [Stylosanthes scabra]
MWSHVKEGDNLYPEEFAKANKLVGIISVNSRDAKWLDFVKKECKVEVGHVLPLLPISECLFSNVDFVKELVEWIKYRHGSADECNCKELVYELEGIYDNQIALKKIRSLKDFDSGNSLSNLLWWIQADITRRNKIVIMGAI